VAAREARLSQPVSNMLPNRDLILKWQVEEEMIEVRLLRNPKKQEGGVEKKVHSKGAQPPMDEED
jgi:hypothetical protein